MLRIFPVGEELNTASVLLETLQLTLMGKIPGYTAKKLIESLFTSVLRDSRGLST